MESKSFPSNFDIAGRYTKHREQYYLRYDEQRYCKTMKKSIFILSLVTIILSSCIDRILGHKYVATIDNARIMLEKSYTKEGLLEHFPKSISNKSVLHIMFTIPDTIFNEDSYNTGFVYMAFKMDEDSLYTYPKIYIYKTKYKDQNFIFDDSFKYYKYYDTLKLRNVYLPDTYPIPYFEDIEFGLGSERNDLDRFGFQISVDINKVPDDLEVFVIKAEHGYFWKKEFDLERPNTLGIWKNGYSCGVAISRKLKTIIYWTKVW